MGDIFFYIHLRYNSFSKVLFGFENFKGKMREKENKDKNVEGKKKWSKIKKINLNLVNYFCILLQINFTYFPPLHKN